LWWLNSTGQVILPAVQSSYANLHSTRALYSSIKTPEVFQRLEQPVLPPLAVSSPLTPCTAGSIIKDSSKIKRGYEQGGLVYTVGKIRRDKKWITRNNAVYSGSVIGCASTLAT
jgi:hypothetical protein